MRYLFVILLLLNIATFGYYGYFVKPNDGESVQQMQHSLKNPVTFDNVSSELPPMIGTKK